MGLEDFRHWFGRDAEGMWLPETACNDATMETLAEAGVKFTILAPDQAWRIRAMGARKKTERDWTDVSDGSIDTRRPYRYFCRSADGEKLPHRFVDVFFFDRRCRRT